MSLANQVSKIDVPDYCLNLRPVKDVTVIFETRCPFIALPHLRTRNTGVLCVAANSEE